MKKALILVGHGSKERGFQGAMNKVASKLRKRRQFGEVSCAYLDINSPSIPAAIDRCVRKSAGEIFVMPYFLLAGRHVTRHIPQIVRQARRRHRGKAVIRLCPYLGYDDKIVEVVKQRVREGM